MVFVFSNLLAVLHAGMDTISINCNIDCNLDCKLCGASPWGRSTVYGKQTVPTTISIIDHPLGEVYVSFVARHFH